MYTKLYMNITNIHLQSSHSEDWDYGCDTNHMVLSCIYMHLQLLLTSAAYHQECIKASYDSYSLFTALCNNRLSLEYLTIQCI